MTDFPIVETNNVASAIATLKEKFPDAVKDDSRQGYYGVIVDKSRLVEVASAIRDELGYDYLSSATAVDYLGIADEMEMVYHA
jgi:NADH-quinone oxidoreductase subunit C/D